VTDEPAEDAFREAFVVHVEPVLRYCQRRLAEKDAAWDVVAETFLTAWRRWDTAPPIQSQTLPWLYGIAANSLRNANRSERRRFNLASRATARSGVDPALRTAIDDPAEGIVTEVQVAVAMAHLSDRDQEIIRLVAWEDLELKEVADILGLSRQTAKVRLHRARRALRDLIPKDSSVPTATTGQIAAELGPCPNPTITISERPRTQEPQ
jgi:RNA polymerase sigma factor (sigma-70 family)